MAYRIGEFKTYMSTRQFTMGQTGVVLTNGMEILFDGTTVKIGDDSFSFPQLRGAVVQGWLVPSEEYSEEQAVLAPRVAANIPVRNANTGNGSAPAFRRNIVVAESDERVVRQAPVHTGGNHRGLYQKTAGGWIPVRRDVETGGAEMGVEVDRAFKSPSRSVTSVMPNSVGSAIKAATEIKVDPGRGISREEMMDRMGEEEREEYKAKLDSIAAQYVPLSERPKAEPTRAKTAKKAAPNAMPVVQGDDLVGVPVAASAAASGNEAGVIQEGGITFRTTNVPKKATPSRPAVQPDDTSSKIGKDGTADARRKIAKVLCPDFPDNYNFDDHWKRREAMIRVHYEGRHDVIRAIFAAESDDFKKLLMQEFPEAFA